MTEPERKVRDVRGGSRDTEELPFKWFALRGCYSGGIEVGQPDRLQFARWPNSPFTRVSSEVLRVRPFGLQFRWVDPSFGGRCRQEVNSAPRDLSVRNS